MAPAPKRHARAVKDLPGPLLRPRLRLIELAHLKKTGRTLALFEDAVPRGLIDGSEHSRLMFVAAADRALMRGTRNLCGLFRRLVERKLWHHITQGDEDAAHERPKRHFYGDLRQRVAAVQPKSPPRVDLSADARFASAAQRAITQHGYRGDPFHIVMREFPDWTRERWGRAVAEVEKARLRRLSARVSANSVRLREIG